MTGATLMLVAGVLQLVAGHDIHTLRNFPEGAIDTWSVLLEHAGKKQAVPSLKKGYLQEAVAWGSFSDLISKTGWSVLDIHSAEDASGQDQSYAAGFLEGALTHTRITQHLQNMWGVDFRGYAAGTVPEKIREFVSENMNWMVSNAEAHHADPYWRTVGYLLAQLHGLADGYEMARERRPGELPLTVEQMLMLVMVDTDMDDLVTAVVAKGHFINEHFLHRRKKRRHRIFDPLPDDAGYVTERRHHGHCSAVVQLSPGHQDLWVTHATWDEFRGMLRIVKYLDMPLPGTVARRMSFTANPGGLYSADDFYNIDTRLTVMETTIDNYNRSLWKNVKPESLMTWARAMVANRLARSGSEWTEIQVRHNSGTCNNQWMVVDYNRFTPGAPLQDGLLWISETMPGHSQRGDVTKVLRQQGSWPSYNTPYFKDIWTVGGYATMEAKSKTDDFSFDKCPRARMFARAREEGTGSTLSSLMSLIRYNNIDDPLAEGDHCNGISARCDLNSREHLSYDCFGAVDAKVAQWRPKADDLSFIAISAPTRSHGERPFSWASVDTSVAGCKPEDHLGHPDTFDFSWYTLPKKWPSPSASTVNAGRAVDLAEEVVEANSTTTPDLLFVLGGGVSFMLLTGLACVIHRSFLQDKASPATYQALPA